MARIAADPGGFLTQVGEWRFMPRYVAFLRGVMPTNAKMPALRRRFESAGFTDVATILGSGNVVFDARAASESALEGAVEVDGYSADRSQSARSAQDLRCAG
ncbi:MAG TPA: DUF1697 domain-containing protein [Gemmatimonadaceae bacterium]